MKITSVTTYLVPPRWLFLRIEADDGTVGWGEPVVEGRAATVAAAVDELADHLVGQDPRNVEDIWTVLYRGGFYRGGPISPGFTMEGVMPRLTSPPGSLS